MPDQPAVSIIIASFNSSQTIVRCLESLRKQKTTLPFEVIVVDSSSDGTAELIEKGFHEVRLCHIPERKFPGDARNRGVAMARGKIIAFMDADCQADVHWVKNIWETHQTITDPVIGGAIANGNQSYVGWAAYFCEFSQWMPYMRPKWLADMPTANLSYKKAIFTKYGRYIEGTYCSDTEFHWRLNRDGHRIRFEPSILVYHYSIGNLGRFIKHECHHGQAFARIRVEYACFSVFQRFIWAIFFFLIPSILWLRILRRNFESRTYLSSFLKSTPLVILGLCSWSLGECIGYLRGTNREKAADSALKRVRHKVNIQGSEGHKMAHKSKRVNHPYFGL